MNEITVLISQSYLKTEAVPRFLTLPHNSRFVTHKQITGAHYTFLLSHVFKASFQKQFRKKKPPNSFVVSVRLSVHTYHGDSRQTDSRKIRYSGVSIKFIRVFRCGFKNYTKYGDLPCRSNYLQDDPPVVLGFFYN